MPQYCMTEQKEQVAKKSFFAGVKEEFRRIIWPTPNSVIRQTGVIILAIIVFGAFFKLIDTGVMFLVNLIQ